MSVIGSNIIAGASGTVETGYQIARSLRFNSADSANLSRTPASAGNRQKWTWSGWVKRSKLGTQQPLLAVDDGTYYCNINFNTSDQLVVQQADAAWANNYGVITNGVYRDVGAWMHVVVAMDTTQATAANRTLIYVNGSLASVSAGSGGGGTYITQNYNTYVNSTIIHRIGGWPRTSFYTDNYIADVLLIDGQALDPTSFGQTDSATGVWVPKAYTGTYGTNGFWLKFDDNSGTTSTTLGKDSSGNSNNWTPNNFSVTAGVGNDSLVDSPTNYGTDTGAGGEVRGNYATWNPLAKDDGTTLTNGNLDLSSTNYGNNTATFFLTSGKWYWEGQGTGYVGAICGNSGINWSTSISNAGSNAIGWWEGGPVYWDGGNNGGSTTFTSTDVVGVALDMDAGVVYFYKNGTLTYTITFGSGTVPNLSAGVFPCFNNGISSGTTKSVSTNFGQRPFAYTAPSGFKALCTQNLPTPAIGASAGNLAGNNFNVITYTGNGAASRNITGVGFQPDFVWYKSRSNGVYFHGLFDAVRGAQKFLASNDVGEEVIHTDRLNAFISDGFTVGSNAGVNENAGTYVAWNWKANGTGSSNTSGTISSTVSANTTAGFSIVTYTGNGTSGATVGHGLGVAPRMVITKKREAGGTNGWWATYHASLSANTNLMLNSAAAAAGTASWTAGIVSAVSSSTFTLTSGSTGAANVNDNTYDYVAYCFAEVAGFSKFGSYIGNGSTDGPFVYCGFRPRFIMIKRTDAATFNWWMEDSTRDTYNPAGRDLAANLPDAEQNDTPVLDMLSNGFKLRTSSYTGFNASGGTYIFAAFGESPFNYSRAR